MREFPAEVRNFARAFVMLQIERQQAYYALDTDALSQVRRSELHRFRGARHRRIRAGRHQGQARFRCTCAVQATAVVGDSR